MQGRKDDEDVVLGTSGDAEIHTPDTDLPDGSLGAEARVISLEDEETLKNYRRTKVEDIIDHTDTRNQLATLAGKALQRTTEKHVFQQIALGSRTAATSVRPSGIAPTAVSGASVSAAFPLTSAGSTDIQEALAESMQLMEERDVDTDENDLFVFLSPYLYQVLRKDKDLVDRDYDGPDFGNSLINGKLMKVEGFWIVKTNLLPSTDLSADTSGPTVRGSYVYRGDFSNTAFLGLKLGGIGARVTPIDVWMDWVTHRRRYDIGAGFVKGLGIRRPEYCIECQISGS